MDKKTPLKKQPYKEVKFPRLIVSQKRHKAMFLEAQRKGISMEELTELNLKISDKVERELKKAIKEGKV